MVKKFRAVPAHLDEPIAAAPVDPLCFLVRGWVWLEARQAEIVALEAVAGDLVVGETRALYVRADVNAAFALAPTTRAGFEIFAHHPAAVTGAPFATNMSFGGCSAT